MLGTSIPFVGPFVGETRYLFADPIPLDPGHRYVIELSINAGTDFSFWLGFSVPPGAGRIIMNDTPVDGASFWFREGLLAVPEPGVASFFFAGALLMILARRFPGGTMGKKQCN